jgi:hypothetical protein
MDIKTSEALYRGDCGAERFLRQTVVYLPSEVVDSLGDNQLRELAVTVFGTIRLGKGYKLSGEVNFDGLSFHVMVLPSVLNQARLIDRRVVNHPDWNLPDRLIEHIMEAI